MDRGQSLIIPPLFDGTNYAYWKVRMRAFLQSLDEKVWQAVEIGWTKHKEAPADWDEAKIKAANFNGRALNVLFSAVTNEEFKKISSTETAKKTWTILQTTYEETKAECPTYLKSIGKSKALAATLSDIEPEDDSDNEDDGILNAFTTTVNPTEGIVEDVDEEEELVKSKFEKMDDQDDIHTTYEKLYKLFEKHEKLYRLATKKLSDVELNREELSTKVDEANQTIGALRFENNFLAEKIKKLEAELFQVRAQLERASSAKLDEMLIIQKSASNKTGLGYEFSSSNNTSASTTVFVPPANNIKIENNDVKTELASENLDKSKSILGAPPKPEKKDTKNPRTKKANSQKPKQKKQHLCHHCGVAGHTRPNCYKWLATQQSNGMIASGNQNQLQTSLAPLRDLLKALMFLSNLNGFNPSPSSLVQGFAKRKGSSKVLKEKGSK
ncbi:hypothetical protein ACB092_12G145900 [Castanea dentata]